MEQVIDFDEWVKNFVPPAAEYYAIYDNDTGVVTGVFPEHSCEGILNKIKIDSELAESIFEGRVSMMSCFVDRHDDVIEVVHKQVLKKIDDVLHRVPEKQFSNIESPDVRIVYNSKSKKIKIELTKELKKKRIRWDGYTRLKFIVSEYNDPHKIIQVASYTLDELLSANKTIKYLGTSDKFSVFTGRIFKNYILERK